MSIKSELSKFSGNSTLVEVLNELRWLNEEGLYIDNANLAREIVKLRSSFIRVLEEMTGNREQHPMPAEVRTARIRRFLSDLKEAAEIEKENWEYQLEENKFRRIMRKRNEYLDEFEEESEIVDPPKTPEGSGSIVIKFDVEPSPSLKETLIRNHFTFKENIAHGWSGDWLGKIAEEIVLARGEVDLPRRKGRFDPWS